MKKIITTIMFAMLLSGCGFSLSQDSEYVSLEVLQNVKGIDDDTFYYGPCVYLHGEDGEIRNWQDFDNVKKQSLENLFTNVPLMKLDNSNNPNDISDEIYIGPLCDCNQYNRASELIQNYELDFPWKLAHGTDELSSCLDFSEFH